MYAVETVEGERRGWVARTLPSMDSLSSWRVLGSNSDGFSADKRKHEKIRVDFSSKSKNKKFLHISVYLRQHIWWFKRSQRHHNPEKGCAETAYTARWD